LVPYCREIITRCLKAWRKYSRYSANKEHIEDRIRDLSASLTAKKCLRDWFFAATHDGGRKLRMRIMAKKLQ
jgi:hypothetical protein